MRPLAPLTALLLAAALVAPAAANPPPSPKGSAAKPAFKADAAQAALLKPASFEVRADKSVAFTGTPAAIIDKDLLDKADLVVTDSGTVCYAVKGGAPEENRVEDKNLVPILKGLLPFARAKGLDVDAVGKKLREWGVPEEFDGRHLLNPDGSATYYGLMFYEGMRDKAYAVPKVSGERLTASLALFESAFDQAFEKNAPDIAQKDLDRAWGMLGASKAGETPLPKMDAGAYKPLSDYKSRLAKAKGDPKAIATLNGLAQTKYHTNYDLHTAPPPEPGKPAAKPDTPKDWPASQLSLPGLLAALDKLNGKPLSAAEQEWIVKSFPMGETVWRMSAPTLWRAGLTGKGVKVAVIDNGVGHSPDIDPQVKSRQNFTRDRGAGGAGDHGTHVTGTILAIAPEAEIRSYRGLVSENGNPRQANDDEEVDKAIIAAIDKAVADGNQVINMSLGGGAHPSDAMNKIITGYANRGVVFVIAAGNTGSEGPEGVETPGVAPKVVTVGAVDANDRFARFTSNGAVWDPATLTYFVKKIVLAPGKDIESAAPSDPTNPWNHQRMSGTSMATPHVAGLAALLVQEVMGTEKDKALAGRKVRSAILDDGTPVNARDLPPDVNPDQDFVLVNPLAAYRRLATPPAPNVATSK